MPGETAALALDPRVARRPITVAEFLRMGDVGILNPRDRVELIEGELIAMAPIGANHAETVLALNAALTAATRGRALVLPQNPVQLNDPKSGSWMIACVGRIGRTVGDGHISAIASASPNG